jgi:hypothetical protein
MWNEILAAVSAILASYAIWQTWHHHSQSIREAAATQRTTFELSVLRDLVVRLDDTNTQPNGPMRLARAIPGLWQLIPAGEVPFWQLMYDAMASEDSPNWDKVEPELSARGMDPTAARRWRIYSALRQDLLEGITARVGRT